MFELEEKNNINVITSKMIQSILKEGQAKQQQQQQQHQQGTPSIGDQKKTISSVSLDDIIEDETTLDYIVDMLSNVDYDDDDHEDHEEDTTMNQLRETLSSILLSSSSSSWEGSIKEGGGNEFVDSLVEALLSVIQPSKKKNKGNNSGATTAVAATTVECCSLSSPSSSTQIQAQAQIQIQTQTQTKTQTTKTTATKEEKRQRREEKRRQRQEQRKQRPPNNNAGNGRLSPNNDNNNKKNKNSNSDDDHHDDGLVLEDDASAWKECTQDGRVWGGRGYGGRGEYSGAVNSVHGNIHLSNVTVTVGDGTELLHETNMNITRGRRYGLIGRNGCGKSTLLRRLVNKSIPGMPHDMNILLVKQQIAGSSNKSTLQTLIDSDKHRTSLLQEQQQLEQLMATTTTIATNTTVVKDGTARAEDESPSSSLSAPPPAAAAATSMMSDEELDRIVNRLNEIALEWDTCDYDNVEERAMEILNGLGFRGYDMIHGPTNALSGGWRMRLALASALFDTKCDLLLLDECTNHLDFHGLHWLIKYLNKDNQNNDYTASNNKAQRTLIVVSHDRMFLDSICTDVVVMEHQKLQYHVGSYSEYERQVQETASRKAQILDASERQRNKAQAFIEKQQQQSKGNNHHVDPKKQRQAKMIKDKKLDRIGNYRDDGKRYKLNSLKQMSADSMRLAQKVVIDVEEPVIRIRIPSPIWLTGITNNDPIIHFQDFSFGYRNNNNKNNNNQNTTNGVADVQKPKQRQRQRQLLLEHVTLNLCRGSKVALVGPNGSGKSTLVNLIYNQHQSNNNSNNDKATTALHSSGDYHTDGEMWIHSNLRIGYVNQYSVEELEHQHGTMTVVEYAEMMLMSGKASSGIVQKASGNVRQYLGAFGLGDTKHAQRTIRQLSGGERMRLCFATAVADQPQLLLLDESTNHVDMETLDALSSALAEYDGSILMVSHNQSFLSGFCNELWVIDDNSGMIMVHHRDESSFDEIFSQYKHDIMSNDVMNVQKRATRRQEKVNMSKQATKQTSGARQNTALL